MIVLPAKEGTTCIRRLYSIGGRRAELFSLCFSSARSACPLMQKRMGKNFGSSALRSSEQLPSQMPPHPGINGKRTPSCEAPVEILEAKPLLSKDYSQAAQCFLS